MKNWKLVVPAREIDITEQELQRITSALDALEQAFRPLTKRIPLELEPAVIFRCLRKEC